MSPRPQGSLERGLVAMTIGVQQDRDFRKRMLEDSQQGEFEQQVQLQFSGTAGNDWGFVDTPVMFEYPFLAAKAQRLVPFDTPHFTKGFELTNASDTLVHIDAQIVKWNINESGWIIGATVRLYATAPSMAAAPQPFQGIAHLRFQGYATYAEGDEYQSS